jgi:hypothetical protein
LIFIHFSAEFHYHVNRTFAGSFLRAAERNRTILHFSYNFGRMAGESRSAYSGTLGRQELQSARGGALEQ